MKPITILFITITLSLVFVLPADGEKIPEIPVTFEDHWFNLHAVDGQGKYYYVEGSKLHRYNPDTKFWEKNIFNSSYSITAVHLTINNYILVGLIDGSIYRSIDRGSSFTLTHELKVGGYTHTEWSIISDENWILIGEYGPKNNTRRVYASKDWGDTWTTVYETPESEGVHIHRVAIDPYTMDWWITVGDYPTAGRVMYSSDNGILWNEVECPTTGRQWQPYQPANILFFEQYILLVNEPIPQVFKVDKKTMKAEYIADIVDFSFFGFAPPYSVVVGNYGIYASIVRYPEHNHDAGIFVSYDEGYTWHQLINFTNWAKKDDPSIKPSNVFGASPIIYVNGFIHAKWKFGWGMTGERGIFNSSRAFKFRDAYYVPILQKFDVDCKNTASPLSIQTNSIVTYFHFNQAKCRISFNVSGDSDTLGYSNVTIPKTCQKCSKWMITIDDVPTTDYIQTENTTHSFLYFTYPQNKTRHIVIQGTWVTSEVPIALILLRFVVFSVIIIIITKRRLSRKPKT